MANVNLTILSFSCDESVMLNHFQKFTENSLPNRNDEIGPRRNFIRNYMSFKLMDSENKETFNSLYLSLVDNFKENDISIAENILIQYLSNIDDALILFYKFQKDYYFDHPEICDQMLEICRRNKKIFCKNIQDYQRMLFFEIFFCRNCNYELLNDIFEISTISFNSFDFICYFCNVICYMEMERILDFYKILKYYKLYEPLLVFWAVIVFRDRKDIAKYITPDCSEKEMDIIILYLNHVYFSMRLPVVHSIEYFTNLTNLFSTTVTVYATNPNIIYKFIALISGICTPFINRKKYRYDAYKYYIEKLTIKLSQINCPYLAIKSCSRVLSEPNDIILYFIDMIYKHCSAQRREYLFNRIGLKIVDNTGGNYSIRVFQPHRDWYAEFKPVESIYSLPIDLQKIYFVSTCKELEMMMNRIFVPGSIIGFDSEWGNSNSITNNTTLIQLAVQSEVYLIDIIALSFDNFKNSYLARSFFYELFCSKDHTRLGFSIMNDYRVLSNSFSLNWRDFSINENHFIDLQIFAHKIFDTPEAITRYNRLPGIPCLIDRSCPNLNSLGLAYFVSTFVGQQMDKDCQKSNWSRRPLASEQIYYAAVDAYCLLQVYEQLLFAQKVLIPTGFPSFYTPIEEYLNNTENNIIPSNQNQVENLKSKESPKFVHQCLFICDSMYSKLCSHLRMCGADAILMDLDKSLKYSLKRNIFNGRFLITTESRLKYIIENYSYALDAVSISSKKATIDQLITLLQHMNIKIDKRQVLNRCSLCNCSVLINVPSFVLKEFKDQNKSINLKQAFDLCENSLNALSPYTENFIKNHYDIKLLIEILPTANFTKYDIMKCCCECGKIFFDGSHGRRFIAQLDKHHLVASAE